MEVALFVAAQAALVISVGAAALALVPRPRLRSRRAPPAGPGGAFLLGVCLLWIGLLLTALNISVTAIDYLGSEDVF